VNVLFTAFFFWISFREWVVIIVNKSPCYQTLDMSGKRTGSFMAIDVQVTEYKEVVFERHWFF